MKKLALLCPILTIVASVHAENYYSYPELLLNLPKLQKKSAINDKHKQIIIKRMDETFKFNIETEQKKQIMEKQIEDLKKLITKTKNIKIRTSLKRVLKKWQEQFDHIKIIEQNNLENGIELVSDDTNCNNEQNNQNDEILEDYNGKDETFDDSKIDQEETEEQIEEEIEEQTEEEDEKEIEQEINDQETKEEVE